MIQDHAPRAKAFRQIVEPLRALKGIISVAKSVEEMRRNPQPGATSALYEVV